METTPQQFLAEMFGGADLFVHQPAFRAWLAEAALKSVSLSSAEAVQAAIQAFEMREVGPTMIGDVALIHMRGPITYKSSWLSYYFGGACVEDLQAQFRVALSDPAVRTIVFRIDSPGGVVTMVPEFADELFAARGVKPIVAVADTLVASAAYWLAAQVETIYTSVSGCLGSIGVYLEHINFSQMLEQAGVKVTLIAHGDRKVDGHPSQPLSDEVKARIQARVDEVGAEFEVAVARGRGVTKKIVVETFGQGEVLRGQKAIAVGMADKRGTFTQVLARLTKAKMGAGMVLAEADPTPLAAAADKPAMHCEICGKSSCACQEPECPADCPTCAPECPCVKEAKEAAALADEHSIIAACSK